MVMNEMIDFCTLKEYPLDQYFHRKIQLSEIRLYECSLLLSFRCLKHI